MSNNDHLQYRNGSNYGPNEQKKVTEWLYDTKWLPTSINNASLNAALMNSLEHVVSKEQYKELSGEKNTIYGVHYVLMTPLNAYKYIKNIYETIPVDNIRREYIINFISNYTNIFAYNDTFYKNNNDIANSYISPMTNLFYIFNLCTKNNPTERQKLNDTKREFTSRMQLLIDDINGKTRGTIDTLNSKILEENKKITDLGTRQNIWNQRIGLM